MSARRITPEILDSLPSSDPSALASRRDLQRLHTLLGQTRLWLRWFQKRYPDRPPASLVDLGCGDGHLLTTLLQKAFPNGGHGSRLFFLDRQPSIPDSALEILRRKNWLPTVIPSDLHEWIRSAPPTELILTNLFLHHFHDSELRDLFKKISTLTATFIAAEPHRGFAGTVGSRLLKFLGCHSVTQHDARVSVQAGFRDHELSGLWSGRSDWSLTEQRMGPFTHFFSAEKHP
jgi:hypothetical protein